MNGAYGLHGPAYEDLSTPPGSRLFIVCGKAADVRGFPSQ